MSGFCLLLMLHKPPTSANPLAAVLLNHRRAIKTGF